MMEYIISAVWTGLELMSCIFFSGAFLSRRKKSRCQIVILMFLWLLVYFYTTLGIHVLAKQTLTVLVFVGVSLTLYSGNFLAHMVLSLICYLFLIIIDTLVINGMCALLGIGYDTLIWRKLSYTTLTTADKMIAVFFSWLLGQLRKRRSFGSYHGRWLILSALFPLISAMMFAVLFYSARHDEEVSLLIVFFSGVLLVANVAMLYIISSIEKVSEHEHDTRMLRQQISIQSKNYNALREGYSVQRKQTHEFERHMQVVQDLLDRKEYDAVQDYVRQLRTNRTLRIFCISSNNPVVDVVLNQKYQVARENGIKMSVKVSDLSAVTIPKNEIVVILSNLLDNAIEACIKMDGEKEIVCNILKEENVFISIRNTSLPVELVDGNFPTTKDSVAEHGYGVQAVKYILEKLNAEYTFVYSKGWFQFVAEIPL